ncbi:hypothetical protein K438DRAFT_1760057 [Mycena galopus ATCC 62051]|nr:hypothetical protein K438DRAFT_1760057 [Mycena galopus ATCC 62051]
MTEAPFDKSEWIGRGKAMADAPPIIYQLAKLEFTMPQSSELTLMPSGRKNAGIHCAWQPAQYFSTNAPDAFDGNTVSRLRRLPIPELKVIEKLLAYGEQAWLDDPELEDADIVPAALGRGQRKKVANARYSGALWEEH